MRKFRKKLARFMVVVVASSMLANFYSAAAFAKEITDACEADDNCSVQPYAGEDCEDAGCEIVAEDAGVDDADEAVTGDEEDVQETDADGADAAGAEDLLTEDDTVADADDTDAADSADSDDANATDQSDVENADAEDADAEDANADKAKNEDGLVEDLISDNEQEDDNTIPAFVPKGIERKNNYLSPVTTTTSGWVTEDGEDYYYVNGQKVTNQFMQIGDNLYHFEWNGVLTKSELFGYYAGEDEENGWSLYNYYYANEDGTLVVNDWYIDEWDDRYYFGEAGVGAQGVVTVDGVAYLFRDGYLQKNSSYRKGNTYYISDEDGVAYEVSNNDWNVVNGKTYYIENGEKITEQVKNIGGKLYVFNYYGERVEDRTYEIWYYDKDLDDWKYDSVRAHADGTLYVNEWYEDRWEDRYYYGEDGIAADGIVSINNTNYLFSDGLLLVNACVTVGNQLCLTDEDGVAYLAKNNSLITVGDKTYYIEDAKKVVSDVRRFNGKLYAFNYSGIMYENCLVDLSKYHADSETWEYRYYRAHEDGTLYENEWYEDEWKQKYYYGKDGLGVDGIVEIDGVLYLFSSGWLCTNSSTSIGDQCYISDENGVVYPVKNNSWNTVNGKKYYVENGEIWRTRGLKEIGGKTYAFNSDGSLYKDTEVIFYGQNDWRGSTYGVKPDGSICRGEWYKGKYYREDGVQIRATIYTIDGKDYMFGQYGDPISNTIMFYKDKTYQIGENGEILGEVSDGWHEGKDSNGSYQYYVREGYLFRNGAFEIDGVYYGFDANGHLAGHKGFAGKANWDAISASRNSSNPYNPNSGNNTNPYENTGNSYDPYDLEMNFTHSVGYKVASANNYAPYVATSNAYNPYYTDETGKLLHNTWYDIEEDGKTFRCYFDDTYQKVAGWLELDGEKYYFDMLGNLQTGWQDIYYKNGEYNRYYFDKDGKMLKGTHKIDGKEYFFDSKGIYRADGKDPNVPDKGETLVMEDGKFVYYEDGVKNDEKYGFVEYGGSKFLVANGEVATSKQGLAQDPENPSEWYFCASGKVTTNITKLVMYNGSTFFVRNGKLDNSVNGFLKYDTGLFFVSKGRVIKTANGLVQDPNNKKDWYFCANGQVQAKKTGVVIYNKAGFYVKNGKLDSSYNGNATYNGKTVKIVNGRMK